MEHGVKGNEANAADAAVSKDEGGEGMRHGYSNETFGHRLMVARHDARMSQEQLALASGVGKNSIARYEAAMVEPGLDNAYKLACALGVSIDSLVELAPPGQRG